MQMIKCYVVVIVETLNGIGSSCDFKGASASLLILRILILVNTLIARSTVRVLLGLTSYYLSNKIVFNAWLATSDWKYF